MIKQTAFWYSGSNWHLEMKKEQGALLPMMPSFIWLIQFQMTSCKHCPCLYWCKRKYSESLMLCSMYFMQLELCFSSLPELCVGISIQEVSNGLCSSYYPCSPALLLDTCCCHSLPWVCMDVHMWGCVSGLCVYWCFLHFMYTKTLMCYVLYE